MEKSGFPSIIEHPLSSFPSLFTMDIIPENREVESRTFESIMKISKIERDKVFLAI